MLRCKSCITVRKRYPRTDTMAASDPVRMAPQGPMIMSAIVPTATPPASVEFCMWTCNKQQTKAFGRHETRTLSHFVLWLRQRMWGIAKRRRYINRQLFMRVSSSSHMSSLLLCYCKLFGWLVQLNSVETKSILSIFIINFKPSIQHHSIAKHRVTSCSQLLSDF